MNLTSKRIIVGIQSNESKLAVDPVTGIRHICVYSWNWSLTTEPPSNNTYDRHKNDMIKMNALF